MLRIIKAETGKWYHAILFWELARVVYNIIMVLIGLASFKIAYINIPLVYEIVGLLLNIVFTFSWIIELLMWRDSPSGNLLKYRKYFFFGYLLLSIALVFAFSILLFLR